jgi:hypothetical protein
MLAAVGVARAVAATTITNSSGGNSQKNLSSPTPPNKIYTLYILVIS